MKSVYVGLKLHISSPYKVEHMGPACVKVESLVLAEPSFRNTWT